jgi:NAD(P)-dependent dehydrogenase (short-subunit alcohol dehydrogenase family)
VIDVNNAMGDRLAGRVAVVTGGGAGIGEAVCLRFAEENANIVVIDRYLDDAESTVSQIEATGDAQAIAAECDVGDEQAVANMAETVSETFETVDILVNNAGVRVKPNPVTEADETSWDKILNVNLKGTAFCSKHLIPLMDDGTGGSIVNVASVGAGKARSGWSQYDSTKGGIISMSRDMACDHVDQDIRVNAISPGWIVTDYHLGDRTGEEAKEYVEKKTIRGGSDSGIMKRGAKPTEVANAVLFLASDESSFITGVNIPVDGGSSVS